MISNGPRTRWHRSWLSPTGMPVFWTSEGMSAQTIPCGRSFPVGLETYASNQRFDEIAKAGEQAQLDPDTVASLTAEPATADELAAICGVLASTLGANSGIVDEGDLQHHRAVMVANVLAQVRLRNQTEHMVGNRLQ